MKLQLWDVVASRLASRLLGNVALSAAKRNEPPPKHHLTLYEYEASPWCRLIREYATILDLQLHIRPCPRQTLFLEGAFDSSSRFRPQAMEYLKSNHQTDDLTFPLLVDRTEEDNPIVLVQSYQILQHLWESYGQSVLPHQSRPDQKWNSNKIPFPLRFLSLAAPSYLRPWPTCGILQTPSLWKEQQSELTLYQTEGCPESRLTREVLCTLEITYRSIPAGQQSSNSLPDDMDSTPVLVDDHRIFHGAEACTHHLWETYWDPDGRMPKWWNGRPTPNLGRSGSFGVGAYTAFVKGSRALVPPKALE